MANPVGRPTKYREGYCQELEDFMSSGKSVTQFAAKLRVAKSTIYEWIDNHPEFSDAFTRAKEFCEAHWEDQMQEAMWSRDANAPLFKYYFANRFGWSDQPKESSDSQGSPIDITFNVSDPVKSIKVTKGEKRSKKQA